MAAPIGQAKKPDKKKCVPNKEDLKQEDIFQAVVIADSFNQRFDPITRELPRVLLPLVNVPLLEYTLHFLINAGVEEIFIFCCSHPEKIKEYLKENDISGGKCVITPILSDACMSVGDALREIENKSLIRGDFILVNGDLVSCVKLDKILVEHRARRLKDKLALMTIVMRKAKPGHRTRCLEEDYVIVTEPTRNKILYHQKVSNQTRIHLPLTIAQGRGDVDIHYDLQDCQLCICSPQVTQLFTDNFDYQTRDDFIRGILVNEEILGNTIHVHITTSGYSARCCNLYMYNSISQDIIYRWAYPLVPDNSMFNRHKGYSFSRRHLYLANTSTVHQDSNLKEDVVLGHNCVVGSATHISQSVIGNNCTIGDNVVISGSYIWDNVTIGSGCEISKSIVCNGASLKHSVTLQPGCIISYNVIVGPSITLKEQTLVSLSSPHDGFDDEPNIPDNKWDTEVLGAECRGRCVSPQLTDPEGELDLIQGLHSVCVSGVDSDSDSSESEGSGESLHQTPPPDDTKLFYNEVMDSLLGGIEENVKCENMVLEVNASKYAYNSTMKEVNQAITKVLLEIPQIRSKTLVEEPSKLLEQLIWLIGQMKGLLKNYLKTSESNIEFLEAFEEYCSQHPQYVTISPKLLHYLYDKDYISEEAILKWFKRPPGTEDPVLNEQCVTLRKKVAPFIIWLEEAEEESD